MRLEKSIFLSKKSLFTLVLTVFLVSCSSPTPQKKVAQSSEMAKSTSIAEVISGDEMVAHAKMLQGNQSTEKLLLASELYLNEEKTAKALWLANQISPLINDEDSQIRLYLVKAQALQTLAQPTLSLVQLNKVDHLAQMASSKKKHKNYQYYHLLSQVLQTLGFEVKSLIAQLQAFALNENIVDESTAEPELLAIWQEFSKLSHWQLTMIGNEDAPHLKGWQALTRYANRFGDNDGFSAYTRQWQKQYPTHPANIIAPQLISQVHVQTMPLESYKNITVLLPLSGRQTAAGEAAQQGILAAFEQQPNVQLNFVDTQQLDWALFAEQLNSQSPSSMSTTVTETNISTPDFIIGPLLRTNVAKLLSLQLENIPTLLLNLPNEASLAPNQYALSMRPEDEAIQAAASLSKRNYQLPVVFSHQDQVSERIATAFIDEWQRNTNYRPELVTYSQGKKMQTKLKATLGVSQSEARINDLNSRIKQTIKYQARNRRDVDMLYIVGSPTQTRLLKPYIDVNISPFADVIPIFASSRSHSAKTDASDARDLAGMRFTEMPWLLPSSQQNKRLANSAKQLFPDRSDSLQRIFAMGYDSLSLINKLSTMQARPYVHHFGQVGVLKMQANNVLSRSLQWGRYQKNSIKQIELD